MKKNLMMILVLALVVVMAVGLVACNNDKGTDAKMEVKKVNSQLDALLEVNALRADAAIIDKTMGSYLLKPDGQFKDLKMVELKGVEFEKEYYGVAAKKGNDKLIKFVNAGIAAAKASGKYEEIANKYNLKGNTIDIPAQPAAPADWKSQLKNEGKVIIGYTENAPMGIVNKDNTVGGFDIDLAREVFKDSGVEIECKLIEWNAKEALLEDINGIDLVWNGLTITEERRNNMEISINYLYNAQTIIVSSKDAKNFTAKDSLKGMKVVVENGSAGQENAEKIAKELNK